MSRVSETESSARLSLPVRGWRPPTQVPGQHLFVWGVEIEAADPASLTVPVELGTVVGVAGPGCRWCGRRFSPDVAEARCAGQFDQEA